MPDPFTRDPKENPFPPIPEAQANLTSLLASVRALTHTVKILTGELGAGTNRSLLQKEAADIVDVVNVIGQPNTLVGVCLLAKSVDQTIANVTFTAITWDVEILDSLNAHSNTVFNTRVVIPSGVNYARFYFDSGFEAGQGAVISRIRKNGAGEHFGHSVSANYFSNVGNPISTGLLPVVSGDYFEADAYRDGGTGVLRAFSTGVGSDRSTAKFQAEFFA